MCKEHCLYREGAGRERGLSDLGKESSFKSEVAEKGIVKRKRLERVV